MALPHLASILELAANLERNIAEGRLPAEARWRSNHDSLEAYATERSITLEQAYVELTTEPEPEPADEPRKGGHAADIYERLDNPDLPGNVWDDLTGMNADEMADYFGDTDPIVFL